MLLYKLFDVNKKRYIYDAYDNILKEISIDAFELFKSGIFNKEYLKYLKEYDLRNIYEQKKLSIGSPLGEHDYLWRIENRQKHMILSLTEDCNMRCVYCGYHEKYEDEYNRKHMTKDTIKKSIINFINHSRKSDELFISFYGGEPLLCIENIKYAVEVYEKNHIGVKINYIVTTNGLLLNDNIVKFLIDKKFLLVISIDGDRKIHDQYRLSKYNKPTYDIIIKNIQRIKTMNPSYFKENVMFNTVLVPPINSVSLNYFFKNSKVNIMDVKYTPYFKNHLISTGYDIREPNPSDINIAEYTLNIAKNLKKFNMVTKDESHVINNPCGYCYPFAKRFYVKNDGKIYICEKVNEEGNNYCIGDVDNWIDYNKLKKVIDGAMKRVKAQCTECWAIRFCSNCYANENEMHSIEYCEKIRWKIEEEYKEYIRLMNDDSEWISMLALMSVE